jgi:hypothetical protein
MEPKNEFEEDEQEEEEDYDDDDAEYNGDQEQVCHHIYYLQYNHFFKDNLTLNLSPSPKLVPIFRLSQSLN